MEQAEESLFDAYLKKNEEIRKYREQLQMRAGQTDMPTLLVLNKIEAEKLKDLLHEAEQARRAWFWTIGSPIGIEQQRIHDRLTSASETMST